MGRRWPSARRSAPAATSSRELRQQREGEVEMDGVRGLGRAIFAAALLMIGSVLNIIYGIAAIGNSKFFIGDHKYVFGDLKTWGWITLILGIMEGIAAASLLGGGGFGRWFGIIAAGLTAISALLSINAAPFLGIAIFALSLYVISGLTQYHPDEDTGLTP